MEIDDLACLLGQLHGNLATLEFYLRGYLYNLRNNPTNSFSDGFDLTTLKEKDHVPDNFITNYTTLHELITAYNNSIDNEKAELKIDPKIVELRDALAHGRFCISQTSGVFILLKFKKPKDGKTCVTYSQKLSITWLDSQVKFVLSEIKKIEAVPNSPFSNS